MLGTSRGTSVLLEQCKSYESKSFEDEELWIDPAVNEYIWKRGIENPPRKITLRIERHDQPDFPIEVTLKED